MVFRAALSGSGLNQVRYQLCPSIRCILDQTPGVVLDRRRGVIYRVNAVATRIIQLLLAGSAVPDIKARVSCDFGVAPDRAAADVDDFLVALLNHELLAELPEDNSRP
jgi:Coenzyme PQQ synthesis protein D (PqqD)